MKYIFCKIIELENHQVLVRKAFEEEGDGADYKLRVTMSFEGVEATVNFGYVDEEKMDKAFDKFDIALAKQIAEQIDKMVTDQ